MKLHYVNSEEFNNAYFLNKIQSNYANSKKHIVNGCFINNYATNYLWDLKVPYELVHYEVLLFPSNREEIPCQPVISDWRFP